MPPVELPVTLSPIRCSHPVTWPVINCDGRAAQAFQTLIFIWIFKKINLQVTGLIKFIYKIQQFLSSLLKCSSLVFQIHTKPLNKIRFADHLFCACLCILVCHKMQVAEPNGDSNLYWGNASKRGIINLCRGGQQEKMQTEALNRYRRYLWRVERLGLKSTS